MARRPSVVGWSLVAERCGWEMGAVPLPEHLELIVSDEPLLDLWAVGPWRVPDGLCEEIGARVERLVEDPRFAGWTTDDSPLLKAQAPLVVAELIVTIEFLFGASAVYTGSHSNLQRWCFGPYYKKSRDPLNSPYSWFVSWGEFLPLHWLKRAPDLDLALELNRESLDVLEGVEPLEPRRQALIRLFEDPPPGLADIEPEDRAEAWPRGPMTRRSRRCPSSPGPSGIWSGSGRGCNRCTSICQRPLRMPSPRTICSSGFCCMPMPTMSPLSSRPFSEWSGIGVCWPSSPSGAATTTGMRG